MHVTQATTTQPAHEPFSAAQPVSQTARRLIALVLTIVTGAILGVAIYLSPDTRGHGTHEQLGLPQCNWVTAFNIPCPTCGMTTAFTHAAEGDFIGSFQSQPFGFLLAILTACTFLVSLYVLATGSAVGSMLSRLWRPRMVWLVVFVLVLAWGYKILAFKGMI